MYIFFIDTPPTSDPLKKCKKFCDHLLEDCMQDVANGMVWSGVEGMKRNTLSSFGHIERMKSEELL